ncbi:MAG: DnaJ domain-containing protein [Myxococcales bacterium]|nr:DnaJ domain-containing protein [Myxococcales bacterium]
MANGVLETRPLVYLLRDLLDRAVTGCLRLTDDRAQVHEVELFEGVPVSLESPVVAEPLLRILLKMGLVSAEDGTPRPGLSDGELVAMLVKRGKLTNEQVHAAHRHHLLLRLDRLFSLAPTTDFVVRQGQSQRGGPKTPCNVLALLMRGFRRLSASARAKHLLDTMGEQRYQLVPEAEIRRLALTRVELTVAEQLRLAPQTLASLVDAGVAPAPVVRAAVFALHELRFLSACGGVAREDVPTSKPRRRVSAPSRRVPGAERQVVAAPVYRDADIDARLARLEHESYFDMLGVTPDASTPTIRAAYLQLLYLWHPDRLPPGLLHRKADMAELCSRFGEACKVLTDPRLRLAYVARLETGSGAVAQQPEPPPDPKTLFERAEIAHRRRENAEAEKLLERVCELDRHHLMARALLAWLRADQLPHPQLADGQVSPRYDAFIAELDVVVRQDASLERPRYWRGQLHKRAGRMREAIADFRAVVKLNPRNIGAERELRIFAMRHRR